MSVCVGAFSKAKTYKNFKLEMKLNPFRCSVWEEQGLLTFISSGFVTKGN